MVKTKTSEVTKEENRTEKEELEVLNVGIVGHIDHGKTTLLSRLTGKWTDTHSEELKRGITIKLGYADATIHENNGLYNIKNGKPLRYVTFVDAPGHEMLMATMLSGAAIMDAAILLVAVNEGIKPQTREHLMALAARGIKNIIIVQNKIDLVNKEKILANYKEIKEFIKGTVAESATIIPVSAQQDINIDKVLKALTEIKIPLRDKESPPIFVIARSFDINRPGTKVAELKGGVLGGALKKGTLKVGDEIEIKPGLYTKKAGQEFYETIKTKIVTLQRGNKTINQAGPGGSLAIETSLDPSITKADSVSGNVSGKVDSLPTIKSSIKMNYELFKEIYSDKEKVLVNPIKTPELLMLSINTSITVGNVIKITPKEVEMNLKIPICDFKGENVGIARNIGGHWRLIGFGETI
ncbi:MAG: translation initiation factor IF-2 subunit gamma [Nanoarchaeota archaeon]